MQPEAKANKFTNNVLPWLLLTLGLTQMFAASLGIKPLQGLASATAASPRPKVFSAVKGLETFSSKFFLQWKTKAGETQKLAITPSNYARLRGPYNRRNVYGAAFAYGPILASDPKYGTPILQSVLNYGLNETAPLLRELDLDPDDIDRDSLEIHIVPRAGCNLDDNLPLVLRCPKIEIKQNDKKAEKK